MARSPGRTRRRTPATRPARRICSKPLGPSPDARLNPARALLGSLLYFPSREILATPGAAGLAYRDLEFDSGDGERLHGWWVAARGERRGHVLLCHGNAGNIGDRIVHADLLTAA